MTATAGGDSIEPPLVEPALVALDVDLGGDAETVIKALAQIVVSARGGDATILGNDAWWREQVQSTGMSGGFAIPHCRSAGVDSACLGVARLTRPVDFGAVDPTTLVLLIATPLGSGAQHLRLLGRLARALVQPGFLMGLHQASTPEDAAAIVQASLT